MSLLCSSPWFLHFWEITLIPRPSFGVTAGWSLSFAQIFLSLSIYLCFVKAWVYNQLSKFWQILRPRAQLYSKSLQIIKQQLVPQLWPCQRQIFRKTHFEDMWRGGHVWGIFSLQDYVLQPASRIFGAKCRDIRQDSNKKLDSTLHRRFFLHVFPTKESMLISRSTYLPSGYDRYDDIQ